VACAAQRTVGYGANNQARTVLPVLPRNFPAPKGAAGNFGKSGHARNFPLSGKTGNFGNSNWKWSRLNRRGIFGNASGIQEVNMLDEEFERLVPLETWLYENRRKRSIWMYGSPRLRHPDDMARWLRRHEELLTQQGAVMRISNAWRIIEPGFGRVLFEILAAERERAWRNKERRK
jgi:hypothetical protein